MQLWEHNWIFPDVLVGSATFNHNTEDDTTVDDWFDLMHPNNSEPKIGKIKVQYRIRFLKNLKGNFYDDFKDNIHIFLQPIIGPFFSDAAVDIQVYMMKI